MNKTCRELTVTGLNAMEHNIIKLDGKNIVSKDNKLIEAKYTLTKSEAQLIFTVISQIDPLKDEDFKSYKINVDDFMKFINVSTKDAFGRIESVVDRLQQNILRIKTDPENQRYTKVGWIMAAEYNPEKREIYILLHPDLRPFLMGLKEKFTSYRLENIIRLKSTFSIRLYELLKQYENTINKTRFFDIEDLKDKLEIKSKYKSYGMFKKRILLSAQEEINEKTDISFEFEELTEKKESEKGRKKVVGIKFIIRLNKEEVKEEKPRIELEVQEIGEHKEITLFEDQDGEITPQIVEDLITEGLSKKEAKRIWEMKFDYIENEAIKEELQKEEISFETYLKSKIMLLNIKRRKGISNPAGWLKEAIKNNYIDSGMEKKNEEERRKKNWEDKKVQKKELEKKKEEISLYWDNKISESHRKFIKENPGMIEKAYKLYLEENKGKEPFLYDQKLSIEENYKKTTLIRAILDFTIQSNFNSETKEMLKRKEEELNPLNVELGVN